MIEIEVVRGRYPRVSHGPRDGDLEAEVTDRGGGRLTIRLDDSRDGAADFWLEFDVRVGPKAAEAE